MRRPAGGRRGTSHVPARHVDVPRRPAELAVTRMREALASLEGIAAPPQVIADLQARLGNVLVFSGHGDEATAGIEVALTLAQHYELGEQLALALGAKATLLSTEGRAAEAGALGGLEGHGRGQLSRKPPLLAGEALCDERPHEREIVGVGKADAPAVRWDHPDDGSSFGHHLTDDIGQEELWRLALGMRGGRGVEGVEGPVEHVEYWLRKTP